MAESKNWRRDPVSRIAVICLSGVCLDVGTIHFIESGLKADGSLVALIALCFAPWLGKVFKSIGKDGVEYSEPEEGLTPKGIELGLSAPTPEATQQAATRLGASDQEFIAVLGREHPQILAAVVRDSMREDPPFGVLSDDARKVLATLWKYQQRYVGPNGEGRWTFIVHTGSPDYVAYVRGLTALASSRLVAVADSGQVCLSDAGLSYCQRHTQELAAWPTTYDKFSN